MFARFKIIFVPLRRNKLQHSNNMAKQKKQTKAKEPVRIRFKELKNGNTSIYLDIYRDGKRSYEFLKLYLIPERSQSAKIQNEQVLASANAIKSRRIIELSNNAAGIKNGAKSKIIFHDWLQIYREKKSARSSASSLKLLKDLLRSLEQYGDKLPMSHIDSDYCAGFANFLINYISPKGGQHLKPTTITGRYNMLLTALNAAVRDEVIESNPGTKIKKNEILPKCESTREFLTVDEVKKLMETPAPKEVIKQAFLFSCFCGLRWSDLCGLTWANIEQNNGRYYVNISMQKTKERLYLPLNSRAISYLPKREERNKAAECVFKDMGSNAMANYYLKMWCKAAGITKNISFHVARHTFATTSLTLGADLYTTSKLLGHTNIATTQIYAKIINEKKNEAVDLFDSAF